MISTSPSILKYKGICLEIGNKACHSYAVDHPEFSAIPLIAP